MSKRIDLCLDTDRGIIRIPFPDIQRIDLFTTRYSDQYKIIDSLIGTSYKVVDGLVYGEFGTIYKYDEEDISRLVNLSGVCLEDLKYLVNQNLRYKIK